MRTSYAEVLDAPAFAWGEGPMPSELRRFNLAAFVYPGLWCLIQGMYGWWFVLLARYVLSVSVSRTIFPPLRGPRSWIALPVSLSEPGRWTLYLGFTAASLAFDVWFGLNANRLFWRGGTGRGGHWRNGDISSVQRYAESQQGCARITLVLVLVGLAMLVVQAVTVAALPVWTPITVAGTVVYWVATGVAVSWWWLDRRRATR